MPSVKFPLVFWKTGDRQVTATVASGIEASAIDKDNAGCVEQLKKYVRWHFAEHGYSFDPEFSKPELEFFDVPIRPEYESRDQRVFPVEYTVNLRVPCVSGVRFDDSIVHG